MVGRSVDQKDEIKRSLKTWLFFEAADNYTFYYIRTLCCVSYYTVRRWKIKFESGVESTKNAPKSGRPKFASHKVIVFKNKGSR